MARSLTLQDLANRKTKLEEVERVYIQLVMGICNGNKTHAAKFLGVGLRTIQRKLQKYAYEDYEEIMTANKRDTE